MDGRKTKSDYCDGLYVYWIGSLEGVPYCMIMTIQEKPEYDIGQIKIDHLSKTGNSYSLDFMIGNKDYFGKGYGAKTLENFVDFFRHEIDLNADTFLIDAAITNPRAKYVYEKAGFKYIADFIMPGNGAFRGDESHFLVKSFSRKISES
jgi:RimJ/RimL family protein N-acetyltransferase